ncbi:head-tail joining protein [Acinetobacter guerrae]|uniref:head-tail joining protein n=1 Tax=Acinetobacter guerrae TaxID=1843371 RepID=UPI00125F3707|nr:hypothetical protein [Acinetobacter guerrae]
MPAPSWENLDVFLQGDAVGGFAVQATVTLRRTGEERVITGIFDEPYLNAQLGEYEVDDAQPRFTCKEVDVVGIRAKDILRLNGREFYVMSYPQQDGTGLCILKLEYEDDPT